MSERSSDIFAAVDQFNLAHDDWANDENQKYPTLSYWESLDELVHTVESGDLPSNCRRLATAVYELAAEQAEFDLSIEIDPPQTFWAARENLARAAKLLRSPDERKHLETIAELDRQKVPHEQIGRMWGLVHSDGSGNIGLVQKELAKPGSVITSSYVHPSDVDEKRETDIARAKFLQLAQQVPSDSADAVDDPPCPETSYDLWVQKVSLPQSARMLKRDESLVAKEWAEFDAENQETDDTAVAVTGTDAHKITDHPAEEMPNEPNEHEVENLDDGSGPVSEDDDDSTTGFEDWTDAEVKLKAEELGVKVPKKFNRARIIDKILDAESEAAARDPGVEESVES